MHVLIAVTHLLGSGHLARALTLARAIEEAGHRATVASGGLPAPHLVTEGLTFVQLPPVKSDGVNFTHLLDEQGNIASDALFDARRRQLIDLLNTIQPDVVITELYPFGRRVLRGEFDALLEAAQRLPRPPVLCCSIRDILAPPSKPEKEQRVRDIISRFYDAVLVHSDKEVTPLEASWPVTDELAERLQYTGFVAQDVAPAHPQGIGRGEIIVSAGGGSVGLALFQTAIEAAHLDPSLRWRVLVGGTDAADVIAHLKKGASENTIIEAARPDFRQILHHAKVSVSMCGYNTALDTLQAGVRAVFVPFDDGGEVEQTLRAQALSKFQGVSLLLQPCLTPCSLLSYVQDACAGPPAVARHDGFDGAVRTVAILEKLCTEQSHEN